MITDSCPCGANFKTDGKYAAENGFRHQDWLDAHAVCRVGAAQARINNERRSVS